MTKKQEQEPASREVVEVARGVLRAQLPIQLPGLGHVNTYCLRDDRGVAIIDPGLPTESSWEALLDRLHTAELSLSHVHTVVITHSHPDHFGGAARLHAETGCRVIAHKEFSVFGERVSEPHLDVSVEFVDNGPEAVPEGNAHAEVTPPWLRPPDGRRVTPWGSRPPELTAEQRSNWERTLSAPEVPLVPRITHTVRNQTSIRLANRDWVVWHTPGHTSDHICLYDPEDGVFLSGDHVLPSITPHISGLGSARDPLQEFFDSLDRVLEVGAVTCCLPAHGGPFANLSERVAAIKGHHRERLDAIVAIGSRIGPGTVREFTEQLFQPRNWSFMADSEVYAHLEHLRLRKQIERREREDGASIFEV